MGKVAVIIPAYNAEAGLEKSARSVLRQTLRDIEVWIVDDGSSDRTGAIADKLAAEDGRVRVIHQDNCGCYQARLNALKQIRTPYFGFADADDEVDPDMYEKMLAMAGKENLDVVQCGYDINGRLEPWRGPTGILESKREVVDRYVKPLLVEGVLGGAFVWNKLYRNQYDFSTFDPTDKDTTFEDMIFNLQFFLCVERIGFISEPLYHYLINEGSSVSKFTAKTLHDFKECVRIRKLVIPRYGIEDTKRIDRHWTWINVRSGVVTALRTPLPVRTRMANVFGLLALLFDHT